MKPSAVFRLPFPPSIWKAYSRGRGGIRVVPSYEYKTFQTHCLYAMRQQASPLPEGPGYEMRITLVRPDWVTKKGTLRKADAENYLKPLIDTVVKGLQSRGDTFDDCQIVDLGVKKLILKNKEPYCIVTISTADLGHATN